MCTFHTSLDFKHLTDEMEILVAMKRIALVSLTLPVLVWELLMEHFKGAQIRYCFLILSSEKYWLTYTALMQCYERNLSLNCSMMDFETELTF